jgi:phosphoribosyl-ATP pyrophosphohydrolase
MSGSDILERLARVLQARHRELPEDSYVSSLFEGGHAAIASKVREETEELIHAAVADDARHTVHEAADLLFHVLVLLENAGIAPSAVLDELERRFGTGGFEEKASRVRRP